MVRQSPSIPFREEEPRCLKNRTHVLQSWMKYSGWYESGPRRGTGGAHWRGQGCAGALPAAPGERPRHEQRGRITCDFASMQRAAIGALANLAGARRRSSTISTNILDPGGAI